MLVLLWLFHGILSLTHYSTVQLKNKLLPSLEVEASSQEMSVPIYILLSTSFFFSMQLEVALNRGGSRIFPRRGCTFLSDIIHWINIANLKRIAKVLCSSTCERALFYLSALLFFCTVLLLLSLESFLLKLFILQMLSLLLGIPSLKDESTNLRIY